jgi:hypothetical protein
MGRHGKTFTTPYFKGKGEKVFRPATLDDLPAINAFIHAKMHKPYGAWSGERIENHIRWYIESVLCGVVLFDHPDLCPRRIGAVVMGRPVVSVRHGYEEPYAVDYNGKVLWVECCVSETGMLGVWAHAMDYFRERGVELSVVAWCRFGKPRNRIYQTTGERLGKLLR